MKTPILALVVLFASLNSLAQVVPHCPALIPTHQDSRFFQLSNLNNDPLDKLKALQALHTLERRLDCQKNSIVINSLECNDSLKELIGSPICRAESDIGYFLILEDMLGNVNLIFNRWD